MCSWWVRPIPAPPERPAWLPRFRRSMVSRWPWWPRRYQPRTCARVKAWSRRRRRRWCVSFRSWALSRSSGLRQARHAFHRKCRPRRAEARSRPRHRRFPCREPITRPLLLRRAHLPRRLPPRPRVLGHLWLPRRIPLQPAVPLLPCNLATSPARSLVPAVVPRRRGPTPSHHAQLLLRALRRQAVARGWRHRRLARQPDVRAPARAHRRRPVNTRAPCLPPMPSTPMYRRGPDLSWRAAILPVLPTTSCRPEARHPREVCATSAPRQPRASPWTRIPGT